jgi:hypothetical protein
MLNVATRSLYCAIADGIHKVRKDSKPTSIPSSDLLGFLKAFPSADAKK